MFIPHRSKCRSMDMPVLQTTTHTGTRNSLTRPLTFMVVRTRIEPQYCKDPEKREGRGKRHCMDASIMQCDSRTHDYDDCWYKALMHGALSEPKQAGVITYIESWMSLATSHACIGTWYVPSECVGNMLCSACEVHHVLACRRLNHLQT